ncbi:MAG: hypothetical protein JSR72_23320 [Proteobacteria bacterium]|nr:hypothetical protein [Pseudomonadota bacterium]
MSSFHFKNLQRVILPTSVIGAPNVQGVVIGGATELDGVPHYNVLFLDHMTRCAKSDVQPRVVGILEHELIAAQPPAMVTEEEAVRRCKVCFDDGHLSAMETIRRERAARAAKRMKPAKAKSKSKGKH